MDISAPVLRYGTAEGQGPGPPRKGATLRKQEGARKRSIPGILFGVVFGRRPEDAPSRLVLAAGTALLAFIYAGSIIAVIEIRAAVIANAERELQTLDTVLVEETSRAVQGVQLVVDGVVERMSESPFSTRDEFAATAARESVRQMMSDRAQAIPQLQTVAVLDADGDLVGLTGTREIPDMGFADNPVFRHLQENPGDGYVLGTTIEFTEGNPLLPLARRVNAPDGQMFGAVVGLLRLNYFADLYASLDIGEGGAISLWRTDGTLLVRHPTAPGIGERFEMPLFERMVDGARPLPFRTRGDDGVRIVAAKKATSYPIVISTSFREDQVLQPWWTAVVYIVLGNIVATLAGGFLIRALVREFENMEVTQKAMQERAEAIAGRVEAEEQLRQAQKLEAVGQLTAGIAHDFNNILTVVIGNLDLVGRRVAREGNPAAARAVDAAMTGARKAATLTHRLLAFARKQPLNPTRIDVSALALELVELLGRTLGESVTVQVEGEPGIWPVHADANQLENVLVNLALNSRDAMPDGGTVRVSMRNLHMDTAGLPDGLEGDFVAISVSDDGEGMTPQILERAFEPFFSTKGVGKGSGLGLSQVYGFAKQSGGDVTMDSAVGAGTTVTLYLPRSVAATEEATVPEASVRSGRGETVLLVEDNREIRTFGAMSLRDLGFRVLEAGDAMEALGTVASSPVDIVVTDIGLPHVDGLELARRIKVTRPDMPVLFITGYGDDGDIAGEFGAAHVMFKPFTYSAVADRISGMLGRESAA
jgi:Signal transduction histidine kinase regulating C4-dicarboxylate transport system